MIDRLRAFVGFVGELMITAGVVLLLFVVWQLWWTDVMSNQRARAELNELREQWSESSAPADSGSAEEDFGEPPVLDAPPDGETWGVLHVPRFGQEWNPRPLLSGVADDDLKKGVGWYESTVMPGAVGNFSLAGHRVTWGRPFFDIEWMQPGDAMVVETESAWYVYRMREAQIVRPWQTEVIAAVPGDPQAEPNERLMTITSCHPKFSARERYIVHLEFDRWQPRDAGRPSALTTPVAVAAQEGSHP